MSLSARAFADLLDHLIAGRDLDDAAASEALRTIMVGEVPAVPVAGFLVALRAKGETAAEIAGLARVMREHAHTITAPPGAVDTAGTGGDRAGTFNVSTLSALVVAAAGTPVVKHGNRAASGRCGSADLLEAFGVAIELEPEAVQACLDTLGICFCFAPRFHPAMRHVMPARRDLGVPTVFNILGPLSNPAAVAHQTVGVADPTMAPKMADVLARLGLRHALVFHGSDGLDELTTTGPSTVWEVRDGAVQVSTVDPVTLGLDVADPTDLRGGGVQENRMIAERILSGQRGAPRDIVVLGAAAALYAADAVADLADGLDRAAEAIDSGAAGELLTRWVTLSREFAEP